MKLLYITQKIHEQDTFIVHWVREFAARGYKIDLVLLDWQPTKVRLHDFDPSSLGCTVHSLGKEQGLPKWKQVWNFVRFVASHKHDRVFIHLNMIWGLFGAPFWLWRKTPTYAWYTHYVMSPGLWTLGRYAKRFFCATPQSLPHFEGNPKKVVVGHGIDMSFWQQRPNTCSNPKELLMVHRLSRSKRVELSLHAMKLLPNEYTLDIYGIDAEPDYANEMRALKTKLGLDDRVRFNGTIPLTEVPNKFSSSKFLLNMASETIDKTMVEAMTCGCYPVTTKGNAEAIGIPFAPADTAESIAEFVQTWAEKEVLPADQMFSIVEDHHSLKRLVAKMDEYIANGK